MDRAIFPSAYVTIISAPTPCQPLVVKLESPIWSESSAIVHQVFMGEDSRLLEHIVTPGTTSDNNGSGRKDRLHSPYDSLAIIGQSGYREKECMSCKLFSSPKANLLSQFK